MSKKAHFDYKLYRKVARGIHDAFCEDGEWCNYGQEPPSELEDNTDLPWEERQELANKRLLWYRHCQVAVDSENIAAHIQFGKGAKVRKYQLRISDTDEDLPFV